MITVSARLHVGIEGRILYRPVPTVGAGPKYVILQSPYRIKIIRVIKLTMPLELLVFDSKIFLRFRNANLAPRAIPIRNYDIIMKDSP